MASCPSHVDEIPLFWDYHAITEIQAMVLLITCYFINYILINETNLTGKNNCKNCHSEDDTVAK